MDVRDALKTELLFLDGGLGTMLQQRGLRPGELPDVWNITRPDAVIALHREYIKAGCRVITTNTFGCAPPKISESGYTVRETVTKAVAHAKAAIRAENAEDRCFAALDVGPSGKLLKPIGDLGFEDAVSYFKEVVSAGAEARADAVLLETFTDSYELKAAVIAAKEASDLPVFASVALDKNGKLLTGGDIESVAALLEGLRADAIGFNCGFGPEEMLPFLDELLSISSVPVIFTPNAGLPREDCSGTVFDLSPGDFARFMIFAAERGARVLGGCCGTTPEHMRKMIAACRSVAPLPIKEKRRTVVSNYSHAVVFDGSAVVVGERINPTGKPRLRQALADGNYEYAVRLGLEQRQNGARILDVNAGAADIDEKDVLPRLVERLQNTVDLPVQIDASEPLAMERAMRLYNGKPLVNSVNGKRESMDAIFPLLRKYGGAAVALTLDEDGIPDTAEGRLEIARKILREAASYGIKKEDIIFDALTMAVSAGGANAAVTLETLRELKHSLGVKTALGVSNVSFGLPAREHMNASMLSAAMAAGLDAAIINPNSRVIMDAYFASAALGGHDPGFERYIGRFSAVSDSPKAAAAEKMSLTLRGAIENGLSEQAALLAAADLEKNPPLEVIDRHIIPALDAVGKGFENGTVFLPRLMMAAEAAKAAFAKVNAALGGGGGSKGTIVIATVKGDVHDIGKNIVKALLENYRFKVIDLGRDVPPQAVLDAARQHNAALVGLSALMTTTVAYMRETVGLLKKELPDCRVMVGGAVLTEAAAASMGAVYVPDAMASVRFADKVFG